jgi:integrase
MGRSRTIFLSKQACNIVKHLYEINGNSIFVFNGQKPNNPISENTVNKFLRDIGYDTRKEICLHGFRTMMASSLNESKLFNADAIEIHIGHEKGDVRSIYIRMAEYAEERKIMLQWWADYLDKISISKYISPSDFKMIKLEEELV